MATNEAVTVEALLQAENACQKYTVVINRLVPFLEELASSSNTQSKWQGGTKIGIGALGVGGGVCAIIAPFTGGASLFVWAACVGGASAVGGVGHAIGTSAMENSHQSQLQQASNDFIVASEEYGQALARLASALNQPGVLEYLDTGARGVQLVAAVIQSITTSVELYASSVPAVTSAFERGLQNLPKVDMLAKAGLGAGSNSASTLGSSASVVGGSGAGSVAQAASVSESLPTAASGGGKLAVGTGAKVFGVLGGAAGVAVGGFDIYSGISKLSAGGSVEGPAQQLIQELQQVRQRVDDDRNLFQQHRLTLQEQRA